MAIGRHSNQHGTGYTYLALLFTLAIFGFGLSVTGVIWSTEARKAKDRELAFIGQAFINAIGSYYQSSPGSVKSFPPSFDELVQDSRFLFVKRHLRKIYLNPYSNQADWVVVYSPSGGIQGIEVVAPQGQKKTYVYTANLVINQ